MKTALFCCLLIPLILLQTAFGAEAPISENSQYCLECHSLFSPGIVEGWKKSRHASVTPAQAMTADKLALKVSSEAVPEELRDVAVGCAECHTVRPEAHKDTFDHNGYDTHVVVSPKDCATCHAVEASQYDKNLMAHAYDNLVGNDVYKLLIHAVNGTPEWERSRMVSKPANAATDEDSCLYCHGTRLQVTGTEERETDQGTMTFPVISGWPNQGVGRINLDGSRGSCTACHTRHEFSIEMARKPYTCKECHVGPDVPAFKVYDASKHGNIFSSANKTWNFEDVPWTVGKDFTAPTCAACHISLLVNTEGEVLVERSHEVKNRLPWRIFGLIYAHPHPKEPDTTIIRNKEGLPLPTDFGGGFASEFLLDERARAEARKTMQSTCLSCHDKSWVDSHWERFLNTIQETNAATGTATQIMVEIWKDGLAEGHLSGGNPFDEFIERVWSDVWLFYSNSIRFTSAMGGGGDYGVFANGRYQATKAIRELEDWFELRRHIKQP
jgi:hydroxylamine dehydrogenase